MDTILVPVSFTIEKDPLEALATTSGNDWGDESPGTCADDAVEQAFHESVGRRRFKLSLAPAQQPAPPVDSLSGSGASGASDGGELMVADDQSYDDCATLCIDAGAQCGSFSYCHLERQCVTIVHFGRDDILANSLDDSDCVVVQSDFLTKFSQLRSRVDKPSKQVAGDQQQKAMKVVTAHDEHDCAHQCMTEAKFNCRSFDYCPTTTTTTTTSGNSPAGGGATTLNECYLQANRDTRQQHEEPMMINWLRKPRHRKPLGELLDLDRWPCSRHLRSYLADFNRLDHVSLAKFNAITQTYNDAQQQFLPVTGVNVDSCASQCVEHQRDCNMFQFCYFAQESPHQLCALAVGGAPKVSRSHLIYSANCYLYTMKRDVTTGAAFIKWRRPPGAQQETINDQVLVDDANGQSASDQDGRQAVGSVALMLTLTVVTFLVGVSVGAAMVLARHYREPLERRHRRLMAFLGRRPT